MVPHAKGHGIHNLIREAKMSLQIVKLSYHTPYSIQTTVVMVVVAMTAITMA